MQGGEPLRARNYEGVSRRSSHSYSQPKGLPWKPRCSANRWEDAVLWSCFTRGQQEGIWKPRGKGRESNRRATLKPREDVIWKDSTHTVC